MIGSGLMERRVEAEQAPIATSGSDGRIGLGVIRAASYREDIELVGFNFRDERGVADSKLMHLVEHADPVYEEFNRIVAVEGTPLQNSVDESSFYTTARIKLADGRVWNIPCSGKEKSKGVIWSSVLEKPELTGVIEASPLKTGNFETDDSRNLIDPDYVDRHPGHHLAGGIGYVIVSSPLNLTKGVDGYPNPIPTIIGGVNDEFDTILAAFERKERVVSASSCTTTALTKLARVMHDAGFDMKKFIALLNHANTVSDKEDKARLLRPSSSGSQKEAARVLGQMGIMFEDGFAIQAKRYPQDTGSQLDLVIDIAGDWTEQSFIGRLQQASSRPEHSEDFGIETKRKVDSAYIKGDLRTSVIDASQVQVIRSANGKRSTVVLSLWFDNEAGYAANLLRLTRKFYVVTKSLVRV